MDSKHLLERVRVFTETKTDYAVAKALEMPQQHVIRIKNGTLTLGPRAIVRVAEITGEPLQLILAIVELEKARSPAAVRFWEKRIPRSMAPVVAQAPSGEPVEPRNNFAECIASKTASVPQTRSVRVTRGPAGLSPWVRNQVSSRLPFAA